MNLDFGSADSVPSSSYGAGAGQAGIWIAPATTPRTDIYGNPANFTITSDGFGGGSGGSGGSPDDMALMDDFRSGNGTEDFMIFSGLNPGQYRLYLYMYRGFLTSVPPDPVGIEAFTSSPLDGALLTTEFVPGWNGHQEGVTYATWDFTLDPGASLGLAARAYEDNPVFVQGLQLVPVPAPAAIPLLLAGALARRRCR